MKHLTSLVYRLLLEQPQTGYGLAKEIEQRTGWKPSWGSIYPLLETLEKERLVTSKEQGRTKVYSLTKKGKAKAQNTLAHTEELLGEIVERMKILDTLMDDDLSVPIAFLTELKEGNNPFLPITKASENMKHELYRLMKQEKLGIKAKEINTILNAANKELKAL